MAKLPKMYVESKLFPRGRLKDGIKKTALPDPANEDLEPKEMREATKVLKAAEKPDTEGELEGKFASSLPQMIDLLNELICAEYSQWLRYYHYAMVLRGHARDALADHFIEHAEQELEHAERLATRVVGLGGYPATKVEQPKTLTKTEEILKELLYREQAGIKLYRDVLKECGDNEGTRQILEANIESEVEHVDDLWRYLKNPEMVKAGAAMESAGRTTFPKEKQAKKEHEESFKQYPRGIGAAGTPDLPERGRDWRGDVDDMPDVPEDADVDIGKTPWEEAFAYNKKAKKSFAGAPVFSHGPVVAPREMQFLMEHGYSEDDVMSGNYKITPCMRAEFNKRMVSSVNKSLGKLRGVQ